MKTNSLLSIICITFFISSIMNANAQKIDRPVFDMTKNTILPEGSKAPAIDLQDMDGKTVSLGQFKGKTIILDVWATWCVPCRTELPVLDSLATAYAAEDVVMIAVCSADSKANFDTFIKNHKVNYKCIFWFDPSGTSLRENSFRAVYGINGFPTTMVINKQGIIQGYGFNPYEIKLHLTEALKFK